MGSKGERAMKYSAQKPILNKLRFRKTCCWECGLNIWAEHFETPILLQKVN